VDAYKIVPIIVLADVIFTLQYHFNMGFVIEKKTKYFAYINASNGILNLTINFLLIPRYGAAYATLISFTYVATMSYLLGKRFFKIHFEFIRLGKILMAAGVVYVAAQHVSLSSLYLTILIKSLVLLSFPLILMRLASSRRRNGASSFPWYAPGRRREAGLRQGGQYMLPSAESV
jgi:O-antigen/teichoic acid export membrane protein